MVNSRMIKGVLSGLFVVSALFVTTNTASAAEECVTLGSGSLFRVTGHSAVYLVSEDSKRLYFPNSEVFHSWYDDFSQVVEISETCVDKYPAPLDPPFGVNFRAGSRLVKVTISPSVYVVEPGNVLRKLESEQVAKELYGENWSKLVRDIADAFWPNFTAKAEGVGESKPHDGMLLKVQGTNIVYYVENGELKRVEDKADEDVRIVKENVLNKLKKADETIKVKEIYSKPDQVIPEGFVKRHDKENESNAKPTAVIKVVSTDGLTVNFSGADSTDPDGDVMIYTWDFGNGAKAFGKEVSHTYKKPDTYKVELKVYDGGHKDIAIQTVTVTPSSADPAPVIEVLSTDNLTVKFSGSKSAGEELKYKWDFGDGAKSEDVEVSHTYKYSDSYTVQLRVTDAYRRIVEITKNISVSDGTTKSDDSTATTTAEVAKTPQERGFNLVCVRETGTNKPIGSEVVITGTNTTITASISYNGDACTLVPKSYTDFYIPQNMLYKGSGALSSSNFDSNGVMFVYLDKIVVSSSSGGY